MSMNVCVAFGETPLFAVIVSGITPLALGVPLRVAVPSPLSTKARPRLDRAAMLAAEMVNAGVGKPDVVTVKLFG